MIRRTLNGDNNLDINVVKGKLTALEQKSGFKLSDLSRDGLIYQVLNQYIPNGKLIDLGGGVSFKNAILCQLGMKVTVIDLLNEYYKNDPSGGYDISDRQTIIQNEGVNFIEGDIIELNLKENFAEGSVDIITCHHVLEHLVHSPKEMLESAFSLLKSGAKFIIEVPNAANLRKRLCLLLGRTNYTEYNLYYHAPKWYGHVREYTKDDLIKLAKNLSVKSYSIVGKNYFGKGLLFFPCFLRPLIDHFLQCFPGLCGSLYLEMVKD